MKVIQCLLTVACGFPAGSLHSSEDLLPPIENRLKNYLDQVVTETDFTGAVLVARKGEVVFSSAMGKLGDGSESILTTETLFEIASVTKSFTGVAAMILAGDGRLDLDESITELLPGIPKNCKEITARHLLRNTSGIPGSNFKGSGTDLSAVIPLFLEGGPRQTPGEKYEYWNQGFSLLSEIIARASSRPYVDFIRESIFKPAEMTSSYFVGDTPAKGGSFCHGQIESWTGPTCDQTSLHGKLRIRIPWNGRTGDYPA